MTTPVNPYIAGNPVTGEEMFFGREDVFDFIRRTLVGRHQDNIVVLYGQRRTGKTSVLYQMHRRLDETYMPVLIDLQGLSMDGMSGFLWELANIIRRTLRRRYGITMPRPQRGDFAEDPRHQFEEVFLPQVWNLIGDRRLMLMFDEAVRLEEQVEAGRLGKDVFDYLRHLMQHGERLRFIYSLGSKLEEMQKEYAVLFSVALYKVISFLDRDAAVALITEPVQDVYEYEPTAVDRILQITSGHPYFTQLLCSSLFLHWQRSDGERVTVSDVEGVLDEVVEQGTAILKYAWEESSDAEKVVLAALAEAADEPNRPITEGQLSNVLQKHGIPLPPGERTRALADLVDRDIIAPAGSYVFTVDLLRIWLRKNKRVEWVRERELAEAVPRWEAESQAVPRKGIAISLPIMGEVVLTPVMLAGTVVAMVAVLLTGLTLLGSVVGFGPLVRPAAPTVIPPVAVVPTATPTALTVIPPTATVNVEATQTALAEKTSIAEERAGLEVTQTQIAQDRARFTTANEATVAAVNTREAEIVATKASIDATQTAFAEPTAKATAAPRPTRTSTPEERLPTPTFTPTSTAIPTATPGETYTPTSTPTRVPPTSTPSETPIPSLHKIAFAIEDERRKLDIWLMDADGGNRRRLPTLLDESWAPDWSPDSQHIVLVGVARSGDPRAIYRVNSDGTDLSNLTGLSIPGESVEAGRPMWSPNGTKIVFEAMTDGNFDIYIMDSDGNNLRRLTDHPAADRRPAWSPDGRYIVFDSKRSEVSEEIYVIESDGSNPRNLTMRTVDVDAAWSPDGQYIAFISFRDSNAEVYRMKADGSEETNLTRNRADDVDVGWTSDGRIIFASDRDGDYEIYVMETGGLYPTRLTDNSVDERLPAWSPKPVVSSTD